MFQWHRIVGYLDKKRKSITITAHDTYGRILEAAHNMSVRRARDAENLSDGAM